MNSTIHFFAFANGVGPKSVPVSGYVTLDRVAKLAKQHMRLCSRFVEAEYDENADLKPATTGSVYAGIRRAGRFRVIDA